MAVWALHSPRPRLSRLLPFEATELVLRLMVKTWNCELVQMEAGLCCAVDPEVAGPLVEAEVSAELEVAAVDRTGFAEGAAVARKGRAAAEVVACTG